MFPLLPRREVLVRGFAETQGRVVGTKIVPTTKQLHIIQFVGHGGEANEGQVSLKVGPPNREV